MNDEYIRDFAPCGPSIGVAYSRQLEHLLPLPQAHESSPIVQVRLSVFRLSLTSGNDCRCVFVSKVTILTGTRIAIEP
jgi:hypothetical protein